MNINIQFIDPLEQRYSTAGDYFVDDKGDWQIRISKMEDARSMMAVMVHEIVELILVMERKIPLESIDAFDIRFEQSRMPGNTDEPGDDPKSPYMEEHTFSTSIERMMCEALKLSWKDHSRNVEGALE